MRKVSSGLIIRSPKGWLLAHATASPRWDIPKGGIDEGESAVDAALRETWEETGLEFYQYKDQLVDLGRHSYLKDKDLHLFVLDIKKEKDLSSCKCHTFIVRKDGRKIPETDKWEWVDENLVLSKVGKSLGRLIIDLGLVKNNNPNWWEESPVNVYKKNKNKI